MGATFAQLVDQGLARDAQAAASWVDRTAFPFQNRFLEVSPGTRVHYVDEGSGDVLLFVHGTPTWSFEWRHVIAAMSKTHRCIAMDNLGFGLSDRPRDFDYSPESHARILRAFVERLNLRDLTLVVHDFGGPIGLPLAVETPELVRRLVIVNTWMWSFADDRAMRLKATVAAGRLGRFLYRYANFSLRAIMPSAYADRRKLTPQIHAQYLAPFPDADSRSRVLHALARALMASSEHYDSLWAQREKLRSIPALIIWGTKDPAFSLSLLQRWGTILPHAGLVRLETGHWPQEEAPSAFTDAIKNFVMGRDNEADELGG